jgi:DNA-binding transcriptional ArsR family regulator
MDGEALLRWLSALASPHRLRVVAALSGGRNHVSGLARDLGMSRPLLYLHLQKLEAAGIVAGSLELSDDGKAMKYFQLVPFDVQITPRVIARAADTLPAAESDKEA